MYRENALPRPAPETRLYWGWRLEFWVKLLLLPLTIPFGALVVVIRFWSTIEAIIRLIHHQY